MSTITDYQINIIARNRVNPVTWYRPPLYHGDCEAARTDPLSNPQADFQWVKADDYQRVHSWDHLSRRDRHEAEQYGHTRETWDGGYIRSWPLGIIPGDRFGHLIIVKNDPNTLRCKVRCDCGTVKSVNTYSLLNGTTLSCGSCRYDNYCSGDLETCRCWGCSGLRWYDTNGLEPSEEARQRLAENRERRNCSG
jgi:hypothetical protein